MLEGYPVKKGAVAMTVDMDIVLKTVGLTKRYRNFTAVDDLHLEIRHGQVYGFLGPNGAGKTTTIALILGLSTASAGHVELFGLDNKDHLESALRRTGVMLEIPSFYPHLSGEDNLRIWGGLSGGVERARISEVLELVGLNGASRKKVGAYSLGMKQRIGLAASLLHDPDLLILDEPTNGLDPVGIRQFRELIKSLGQAGKTVFVSSHLLSEIEQMCDQVGIIKGGRLLRQTSVAALRSRAEALHVRVTDSAGAIRVMERLSWVTGVQRQQDDSLVVGAAPEHAAELSKALADGGVYLAELRPRESNLEEFFVEVTGEVNANA